MIVVDERPHISRCMTSPLTRTFVISREEGDDWLAGHWEPKGFTKRELDVMSVTVARGIGHRNGGPGGAP